MINGKKVLAVTLARGGSKGIPKKNIHNINGRPLIAYTIQECLESKYIDKYIVSTDCEEIAAVALNHGAHVPFMRPSNLANDSASSADALIHAVNWANKGDDHYDIVVEVMATNPLKKALHIDHCIQLMENNGHPYCVAVQELHDHHPARIKYLENGIMKDFFPEVLESRRQDLEPQAYIRAGSIYCMTSDALLSTGARYGKDNTLAYVLPDEFVINIDEPRDMVLAKLLIEEREQREA
jgi:CMP-N,N'-diacetyllegionaminic acid synthase